MHELTIRYIYRFLAFNYSGHNDSSSILSKTGLFFFFVYALRLESQFRILVAQMFHVIIRAHQPLIIGSYITHLALYIFPSGIDFSSFTYAFTMDPLDEYCLDSMGLLSGTPIGFHFSPQVLLAATEFFVNKIVQLLRNKRSNPLLLWKNE